MHRARYRGDSAEVGVWKGDHSVDILRNWPAGGKHLLVDPYKHVPCPRGEVRDDPPEPLVWARELGQRLFLIRTTDYQLDSDRAAAVWGGPERPPPGHWR